MRRRRVHDLAFRWTFAYFSLCACAVVVSANATLSAWWYALEGAAVRGVVALFGGPPSTAAQNWESVSPVSTLIVLCLAALLALVAACIWTAADGGGGDARLRRWFTIVLRYYAAVVVLIYGGFKVVNSQFPPLLLDQLLEPLGSFRPMGVLWSFMSTSNTYSAFAGFAECVGAFLLFFRQTTWMGGCVLVGVMGNVALMNWAYDVPVKGLSTNLLLIAAVLSLPGVRRVIPMVAQDWRAEERLTTRWMRGSLCTRAAIIWKVALVVAATFVPIVFSTYVRRSMRVRSPLFGAYDVQRFSADGQERAPLTTDGARWRRVVFTVPTLMTIQYMDDRFVRREVVIDTIARRVVAPPRPNHRAIELSYDETPRNPWVVRGREGTVRLELTLSPIDMTREFPLGRPYRWFGSQ